MGGRRTRLAVVSRRALLLPGPVARATDEIAAERHPGKRLDHYAICCSRRCFCSYLRPAGIYRAKPVGERSGRSAERGWGVPVATTAVLAHAGTNPRGKARWYLEVFCSELCP